MNVEEYRQRSTSRAAQAETDFQEAVLDLETVLRDLNQATRELHEVSRERNELRNKNDRLWGILEQLLNDVSEGLDPEMLGVVRAMLRDRKKRKES